MLAMSGVIPASARSRAVRGIHGEPARHGLIFEVIGRPGHERYRVRWDEQHESIVYPADGVRVVHDAPKRAPRRS